MKAVFPYTYQNHLQVTYPQDANAMLVEVGKPKDVIGRPMDEAIRAARLIADGVPSTETIWLCLSGGIDSEAMARAFLLAKVSFQVAIMRFAGQLNQHDITDAVQFCEQNNIAYTFFELDILDFFESGRFFDFARRSRCRSPQLAAHMYLLERIPGVPVLSWNATSVQWADEPGGKVRLALPSELHFSYQRFLESMDRPGVPFFFLHTPELFYSFFHTPTLRELLFQNGVMKGQVSSYLSKCKAYQEGGFDVQARADKWTGFEKVKEVYAQRLNSDNSLFDQIFRRPLELLYPDPARHYARVSARGLQSRANDV